MCRSNGSKIACSSRGGRMRSWWPTEDNNAAGRLRWQPELTDYGLNVEHTKLGYWNITSDRMLLDPATERAILDVLASGEKGTVPMCRNGRRVLRTRDSPLAVPCSRH